MATQTPIPALKFADEHVERILKRQKTATLRLDLDDPLPIGQRFDLTDQDGERFASAIVSDRGWTTIEMAAKMDIDGHRTYRNTEHLIEELGEYYPEKDLDSRVRVEIIYWEDLWE